MLHVSNSACQGHVPPFIYHIILTSTHTQTHTLSSPRPAPWEAPVASRSLLLDQPGTAPPPLHHCCLRRAAIVCLRRCVFMSVFLVGDKQKVSAVKVKMICPQRSMQKLKIPTKVLVEEEEKTVENSDTKQSLLKRRESQLHTNLDTHS